MFFAKYEIKRTKKRFALQEDIATVYTPEDIEELRQGLNSNRKYESFYVLEMKCVSSKTIDTKILV